MAQHPRPDFEALRREADEATTRLLTAIEHTEQEVRPTVVLLLAHLVVALTLIRDRAKRQRLAAGVAEALPDTVESVLADERAALAQAAGS